MSYKKLKIVVPKIKLLRRFGLNKHVLNYSIYRLNKIKNRLLNTKVSGTEHDKLINVIEFVEKLQLLNLINSSRNKKQLLENHNF